VEYEGITKRQFAGIGNNLIGVENSRMNCDTPRLVPDDAFAVFACGLRIVAVAVING
jgi:hypothetical protein